jgi:hypothetical protein
MINVQPTYYDAVKASVFIPATVIGSIRPNGERDRHASPREHSGVIDAGISVQSTPN